MSLPQLKSLHKTIKQNYSAFAKGLATVYESILFRSKLANPLELAQLGKYTNLMRNEVTVSLAKVDEHLLVLSCIDVHVLPSNQILLFCPYKSNMVVLSKSGDLIHFKAFQKDFSHDVKVNATNIVVFDSRNRNVEIYNFKLELVHSIRLERSYDGLGLKLNNYEIALGRNDNSDQFVITCYNYETTNSKKKEISINTGDLKSFIDFGIEEQEYYFKLVDLNDRFIFIECSDIYDNEKDNTVNYIFLLNRHDNNNLFKYFRSEHARWLIDNNQIASLSDEFIPIEIKEIDGSVHYYLLLQFDFYKNI